MIDFPESEFSELLEKFRANRPLVHVLTNDVVQEITADVLLAAGASPAMVVAPEESGTFVPRTLRYWGYGGHWDYWESRAVSAAHVGFAFAASLACGSEPSCLSCSSCSSCLRLAALSPLRRPNCFK